MALAREIREATDQVMPDLLPGTQYEEALWDMAKVVLDEEELTPKERGWVLSELGF